MTLSDMAVKVCTTVSRGDDDSLAAAKGFLRSWYQSIWDSFLWRDSLIIAETTVLVDAGTEDYLAEAVFGYDVERPLAVWNKADPLELTINQLTDLARLDPGSLNNVGGLLGWAEQPAVGIPTPPHSTGIPILSFEYFSASDSGISIGVQGTDLVNGADVTEKVLLSNFVQTVNTFTTVSRITKPITVGAVSVGVTPLGHNIQWAWPAQSTVAEFARIKMLPAPTLASVGPGLTLQAVCKRKLPPMTADTDAPVLRGCDACLVALATGDMLRREKQFEKAAGLFSQGGGLLDSLKAGETTRSATAFRIIPEVYHQSASTQLGF
jgi:hypothetical protein